MVEIAYENCPSFGNVHVSKSKNNNIFFEIILLLY